VEEFGNQVEVVIGALDTGMAHVSGKVRESRVDIDTGGDPSVEVCQSEMMTKVVGARSVARSLPKTGILPDSAEYWAYAAASITFRPGCREEVDPVGIDSGNSCSIAFEESEKIVRYRDLPIASPFGAEDGDGSA
jgi:hypothetical protein